MHVVIVPDSFKGSLSAREVASALGAGIAAAYPAARISLLPLSDGGDGFLEAVADPLGATRRTALVLDPLGRTVEAHFGYVASNATAVIETAEASGLHLLLTTERDPLRASTLGTGELLVAALDAGARKLLVGIGGSATNDGGAGMAIALGARLLDVSGSPIRDGGAALSGLAAIDTADLDPRLAEVEVLVARDVDGPLLGPRGASVAYGPQKGASPQDVALLERALAHYATVVEETLGVDVREEPGAGAAGGLGFGLAAFCGAQLVSGIDLVLDSVGADELFASADLIVTGEGRIDEQTLRGKVVSGVARRARRRGVPVVAVGGSVDEMDTETRARFRDEGIVDVLSVGSSPQDPDATKQRLQALGARLTL